MYMFACGSSDVELGMGTVIADKFRETCRENLGNVHSNIFEIVLTDDDPKWGADQSGIGTAGV